MRKPGLRPIDFLIIILLVTSMLLLVCTVLGENAKLHFGGELDSFRIIGEYSVNGGEFVPYTNETSILIHDDYNDVVIRGHFDHNIGENRQIMLRIIDLRVNISINGEQVFSYGAAGSYPRMAVSGGNVWQSFVSGGITTSDNVEIELTNFYTNSITTAFDTFLGSMYSGSEHILFAQLRTSKIGGFIFSISVMVLGGLMMIAALAVSKHKLPYSKSMIYFGGFTFCSGAYLLVDFDIFSYLVPYPFFNNTLSILSLSLACVFACIAIETVFTSKYKKILHVCTYVFVIYTFAAIILQFAGLRDLYTLIWILIILVTITCFFVTGGLVYEAFFLKHTYQKTLLIALSSLILGGIVEVVNYFTEWITPLLGLKIGLAIFILVRAFSMFMLMNKNLQRLKGAQKLESELAQSRITIMLSQIKPHFIYNALNAISGLCLTDPLKADEAIVDFSDYLRANISSLQSDKPIRFYEELEHIKHYASLERLRFGEKVKVEYDINFSRFMLPTLTLQPIVENAVKHGVCRKSEGGTIIISTRSTDDSIIISVKDDGVGFNPDGIFDEEDSVSAADDAHIAVGLKNVKSRLKYLADADLRIESTVGVGTEVLIILPLSAASQPADVKPEVNA